MTAPFAGVVGWPAVHSLSPLMMKTWLEASGLSGAYGVFEVPPERFDAFLRAGPALGLTGLNVTLPHKGAALALADRVTPAAQAVGAANRIVFTQAGIEADNTDIDGVAAALAGEPGAGPAVLIGAGGAARAALHHLRGQDRAVRIVNRTPERAEVLASSMGVDADISTDLDQALDGASLVINATSLGMSGRPPLTPDFTRCAPGALAFDMVYTPLATGFLTAAAAAGLNTVDGLTMLIGQARPSFEAFFSAPAPADAAVREILEQALER